MQRSLIFITGLALSLAGLGWLGLRVRPAPFPPYAYTGAPLERTPLPAGLPAPVERFYRRLYGEHVPVIRSAVISGRGTMRPVKGGPTLPMRFRFTHEAGQSYRHYIEATFFGLPIMRANEHFVDGKERMELPWATAAGPNYDQAGNLGMWGESISWLPAILLTDSRVRWEPVDDATAILVVPFGEGEDRFVIRFDPASGMLKLMEAMRYKGEAPVKTLWIGEASEWQPIDTPVPAARVGNLTWRDEGTPWAVFIVEELVYNAEVDVSLDARGP
jgi:hypothetical protein